MTSFSEYLEKTKENLQALGRHPANQPFEIKPEIKSSKGILLIHGLLDSPAKMKDLANFYASLGFLVRVILLPGHGTAPQDLMSVTHQDWQECVKFAIDSLHQDVSEVHACGFSTGALLALQHQLLYQDLKSLTLLAIPFAMRGVNRTSIAAIAALIKLRLHSPWVVQNPELDYARYQSIPFETVRQVYLLKNIVLETLNSCSLNIPIFVVASLEDTTVAFKPLLKFFKAHAADNSHFIYFGAKDLQIKDPRVSFVSSVVPEEHILTLSHIAILVSPDNPHYGRHGDYQSPLMTPKDYTGAEYLGETTLMHRKKVAMRRITFNPRFDELVGALEKFLKQLTSSK